MIANLPLPPGHGSDQVSRLETGFHEGSRAEGPIPTDHEKRWSVLPAQVLVCLFGFQVGGVRVREVLADPLAGAGVIADFREDLAESTGTAGVLRFALNVQGAFVLHVA